MTTTQPSVSAVSSGACSEPNLGYVVTIAGIGTLGGLLFGYDWVVSGGAKPFFENYFQLNKRGTDWLDEQLCVAGLVAWINAFRRRERAIRPKEGACYSVPFCLLSLRF